MGKCITVYDNSVEIIEMLWIVLKELKTGLAQSLNSCDHAYFKYRCPCVFFSTVILFTAWNGPRNYGGFTTPKVPRIHMLLLENTVSNCHPQCQKRLTHLCKMLEHV